MQPLTAGITKANTGVDGIVWHILGQTYVPKQVSEHSFAWHATFPPGTFVPPHIHPTQEEFIYMFEGRFDLLIDGKDFVAGYGSDGYRTNVRTFIKRIRKKFRDLDPGFGCIQNYASFGYRWIVA